MDAMKYLYENENKVLLNNDTKLGLDILADKIEAVALETSEVWLEVHYNKKTDFIIEFKDLHKVKNLCKNMMQITCAKAHEAWEMISKLIDNILSNCVLITFMHVMTIEFDMNEIKEKNFCPCFFFEFDVENMRHRTEYRVEEIYEAFFGIVKHEFDCVEEIDNLNFILQENLLIWNVGFMMTRENVLRIVSTPIPANTVQLLLNKLDYDKTACKRFVEDDDAEIVIDFDIEADNFNNFGLGIYYKKYQKRITFIDNLFAKGLITKQELDVIKNWQHRKVVRKENNVSLIQWQYAHYKVKYNEHNSCPKVYLRVREITG